MHKLYEYACDELKELEQKADEKGGLSSAEMDYANKLTELKKNILKIEMLEDEGYSAEYRDDRSMRSYRRGGGVYARRRDSMGRYSRAEAKEEMVEQLRDMMHNAPDDRMRQRIEQLIRDFEK